MIAVDAPFNVTYGKTPLLIRPRKVGGSTVFVVAFPDDRQPLVLTRATGQNRPVFWTSIPEGRQKEAEEIGPLITEYYQSQVGGK